MSSDLARKLATLGHLLENGFDKMLVRIDKRLQTEAPGARWEEYYANFFIERCAS